MTVTLLYPLTTCIHVIVPHFILKTLHTASQVHREPFCIWLMICSGQLL